MRQALFSALVPSPAADRVGRGMQLARRGDAGGPRKPRLVGINHVALEVGNLEAALAFYGRIFGFELRGRAEGPAFLDMGDQLLVLSEGRTQPFDKHRHFGMVDDRSRVSELAVAAGAEFAQGPFLGSRDPVGQPGRSRR